MYNVSCFNCTRNCAVKGKARIVETCHVYQARCSEMAEAEDMKGKCKTCAAFNKLNTHLDGECRMRSPSSRVVQHWESTRYGHRDVIPIWPVMKEGEWCLDWREKIADGA